MARENKTRYVVLGLLSTGPKSGYDISKEVHAAIRHFWRESFGQIYPMLSRLCDEGLVGRTTADNGARARHVYHITAAGRRELEHWLPEPPEPESIRLELLLKLYFGSISTPDDMMRLVEEFLARNEHLVESFAEMEAEWNRTTDRSLDSQFQLITLRSGLYVTQARVAWAKETLATLSALPRPRRRRTRAAKQKPRPSRRKT